IWMDEAGRRLQQCENLGQARLRKIRLKMPPNCRRSAALTTRALLRRDRLDDELAAALGGQGRLCFGNCGSNQSFDGWLGESSGALQPDEAHLVATALQHAIGIGEPGAIVKEQSDAVRV